MCRVAVLAAKQVVQAMLGRRERARDLMPEAAKPRRADRDEERFGGHDPSVQVGHPAVDEVLAGQVLVHAVTVPQSVRTTGTAKAVEGGCRINRPTTEQEPPCGGDEYQ